MREEGLLKIASALRCIRQVKRYVLAENASYNVPLLEEYAGELEALSALERDIEAAVVSETELSDDASSALGDIRRSIRNANASVKDKLNAIINSPAYRKALQEPIVTIRSGRYVVPVKNESRGAVDGIVHDTSSTGLTVFIEPAAVVALNNRIRELEIEQAKEIEIILRRFSQRIADEADYLMNDERIVLLLDALFAKAEYAVQNGHTRPEILTRKAVKLYHSSHPLLNRGKAVASDILLGEDYAQMVITGPNTGGKTVALKTRGLSVMMAQCALFIPAESGSGVYVFDEVFADIGDEQSIAQSLSTFSSHMINIIQILKAADADSLVLLDELGAGTDPAEGAALARAVLEKIKACGALSAATTHYNEIKQYALTEPGVVNASMEFDVANLKPTYKLHIGVPGKSNAFEISRRLGLEEDVIRRAGEVMSGAHAEFADIMSKLEEKRGRPRAAAHAEAQKWRTGK
jgi:DNA mismatch repair protein MutS2